MDTIDFKRMAGFIQDTDKSGGCTMHVATGFKPKSGYMVSIGVEARHDHLNMQTLGEFLILHRSELAQGNHYLGSWIHKGQYYLDVSVNTVTLSQAVDLAKENKQIAVWDIDRGKEVPILC